MAEHKERRHSCQRSDRSSRQKQGLAQL